MDKHIRNWGSRAHRVRSTDMLTADEERYLVRAWQEHGDSRARDRLINAFAPMAASVAKRFKPGSGEADPDLVQQANIGLLKAADRFDPDRENRFATYAVWWVRAEVQAYKRANMSIVKPPNSPQMRRAAVQIAALDAETAANPRIDRAEADARLAASLGVDAKRVDELRAQVTRRDHSLNVPTFGDESEDRIALLVDPESLQDPAPLQRLETAVLRRKLVELLSALPDRERDIVVATQLHDPPATLESLSTRYGISRERVRQLRERGFEKLRKAMRQRDLTPKSFL